MDGGDRLHRIILREYRNNQLLNEAIWAQKAVDERKIGGVLICVTKE